MKQFYQSQTGALVLIKRNWVAAGRFYILIVVGIMIFAVRPGVAAHRFICAAALGALLGLFTYGTYELTNLTSLKGMDGDHGDYRRHLEMLRHCGSRLCRLCSGDVADSRGAV